MTVKRKTVLEDGKAGGISPATNDAEDIVQIARPVSVEYRLQGVSEMLYHRYNVDAVKAKNEASKGSKAKKEDDIESYLYRDEENYICLPSEYVRQAAINAAKYRQDPRSPRKSLMDLAKAALVSEDILLRMTPEINDTSYDIDRRRVVVQRSAVTRARPCIRPGWEVIGRMMLMLPQYISLRLFHELLSDAGKFVGVGDFRPTFGRFTITHFEEI